MLGQVAVPEIYTMDKLTDKKIYFGWIIKKRCVQVMNVSVQYTERGSKLLIAIYHFLRFKRVSTSILSLFYGASISDRTNIRLCMKMQV